MLWIPFWNHFPSRIDEQIDTEIDAEQVMKIRRTIMMRKQKSFSIVFGIASHGKSKFLKKVHVRESCEFPSRIRVAEGSPKKKESKQI